MYKTIILQVIVLLLFTSCISSNEEETEIKILKEQLASGDAQIDVLETELDELEKIIEKIVMEQEETTKKQEEMKLYFTEEYEKLKKNQSIDARILESRIESAESQNDIISGYIQKLPGYEDGIGGWIRFNESNQLEINELEWITIDDKDRIAELDLNIEDDFPNGFYLNDEIELFEPIMIDNTVSFFTLNYYQLPIRVGMEQFKEEVQKHGNQMYCELIKYDGNVIAIKQNYIP